MLNYGKRFAPTIPLHAYHHQRGGLCVVKCLSDYGQSLGFANDGILVEIQKSQALTFYWDCSYWSNYTEENERLFIGGLQMLQFMTIRNVERDRNFAPWIRPLTHLDTMIRGWPAVEMGLPSEKHLEKLQELVSLEVDGVSTGEPYVDRLFHHFAANVEFIDINLAIHAMSQFLLDGQDRVMYGYRHWRSMWFKDVDDDESVDICFFLRVFKNLKTLTVSRWSGYGWMRSIALDKSFMESIIDAVDLMNDDEDPSADLNELIVMDPDLTESNFDNLQEMVTDYNQTMFGFLGWEMKQITYRRSDIPSFGKCESLSICRRRNC